MRIGLLVPCVLAAVACGGCGACKKESSDEAPPSTADRDALWALAPEGARGGIVVAPRGVDLLAGAVTRVRAFVKAAPELAPFAEVVESALSAWTTSDDPLTELGFSRDKGGAVFFTKDGMMVVLPVASRQLFLDKLNARRQQEHPGGGVVQQKAGMDYIGGGYCNEIHGLYVCATSEVLLERVGKGDLKTGLALADARGDIEAVAIQLPFGGRGEGTVAAVGKLDRGTLVVRGAITGLPGTLTEKLANSATPRTDTQRSSGFGVVDLRPFLRNVPPETPLPGGTTMRDVAAAIAGPLTISVPAGKLTLDGELPLSNPAPVAALLEHCTDVPVLKTLGAKIEKGACHVTIPNGNLTLDAWVESNKVRIGVRGQTITGATVAMSPTGGELARGRWGFAFWGRGTMFGEAPIIGAPDSSSGSFDPGQATSIRVLTLLDELGVGIRTDGDKVRFLAVVRTVFANPDHVLPKILAITTQDLASGKAPKLAKDIADNAKFTPFADDFEAGQGGLIIPTAVIGMTAAEVIPAFLEFRRAAEAQQELKPGELTQLIVHRMAADAYPAWAAQHPNECPKTLADLDAQVGTRFPQDEWGHPWVIQCGKDLPAGVSGIAISSSGPDGQLGTADDIRSY